MSRLLLASRSPARVRMLANAGVQVDQRPADVDEAALKRRAAGATASSIALQLAQAKALAVYDHDALVIGADQTLEMDGELFDKPASLAQARQQLLRMRGRTHQLHAAAAVARGGAVVWSLVDTVTLQVRAFSAAYLDRYLHSEGEALLGCVGAYRLEGVGAQLFDRIEGDYFTVLGLPLLPLLGYLRGACEIDT